ncbi:glycine zipper 2TM domain-containing protein [Sphingomonas sp. Y38-1Y]|uniref:glycine zipper 2TM domain-containing protein n=1 Tax=Sphingomonas sp. Y38-1Y TaxID=3078265 RepID=UPI0028EFBC08|nr:glycine zipper 2TM domain-containing protein [Sphingomonas sp. Y38-1Y]
MFKQLMLAATAVTMGTTALVVPTAPAQAQGYYGQDYGYAGQRYRDRGYYGDRRYDRGYDRRYYGNDRRYYRNRARERCNDGDGGTIVGAIAGGLLGNQIAGRGDRTLGTILGGGVGALAGRAIDRSDRPGYCRR